MAYKPDRVKIEAAHKQMAESKDRDIKILEIDCYDAIERMRGLKKIAKEAKVSIKTVEQRIKQLKKSKKPNKKQVNPSLVDLRFNSPDLIWDIHKELDKRHKLDHKEKLAVFIVGVSAELKDDSDHCSAALKGDSAAGKDSLIDTVLVHLPTEDNLKLTRATRATLEEEAKELKRIAFSEINKHRDHGANSDIVESFKQLAEGGLNVMKRDHSTGFESTKTIKTGQKTLFYGTTESENDEELETRYVIISVKGYSKKNKAVVDDTSKKARSVEYYLRKFDKTESWIARSIRNLDHNIQVIIPFTAAFESKIKDIDGKEKYLWDYSKERIKRDAKRLYSLTRAIAWLYQRQRHIEEIEGQKFLYAEPDDFILALRIFAEFFDLTYSGLDHRVQKTYEAIKRLGGKHDGEIISLGFNGERFSGWVIRHLLMKEIGVSSTNTIKHYEETLKDRQLIETHWDKYIPRAYLVRDVGYQQGVNRVSLPISVRAIDRLLTPYLTGLPCYNTHTITRLNFDYLDTLSDLAKEDTVYQGKIETLKIETLNSKGNTQCVYDNGGKKIETWMEKVGEK